MIEVHKNLFVGDDSDAFHLRPGWSILHAAKEPWHRHAVGYSTSGAPKDDPDYLFARMSPGEMALNLVDAADPRFILPAVVNAGVSFIVERLAAGDKVLCHCNQGQSRGPGIAFLFMLQAGLLPADPLTAFRELYPPFAPAQGMRLFIERKVGSLTEGTA